MFEWKIGKEFIKSLYLFFNPDEILFKSIYNYI